MSFSVKSAICLGLLALALTACDEFAGLNVPKYGSACTVAFDQEGTLFAPVLNLPIRLYLDPHFTSSQKSDIRSAAEQWNKFSQYSLHKKFFEISGERQVPNFTSYYSGRDYCGDDVGSGVSIISESSVSHWQRIGYSEATGGMTIRCGTGGASSAPRMVVMVNTVELRYDLFFGVVLHELGHVIGLDHSCANGRGAYGAPSCASLGSKHPYRKAVMTGMNDYSSVSDGTYVRIIGTPMAHLEQNDLDRAYCLYSNPPNTYFGGRF